MNSGTNTLVARVIDKTTLSRSYLPALGYEFSVTWTIDYTLPVELTDFYGVLNEDEAVDLVWRTSSEINNEYFEIEHSPSGEKFSKIGIMAGQGNSTNIHQYNFVHEFPNYGINYYRLKQIDFDGEFAYSEIIEISRKEGEESIGKIHPNPISSNNIYMDYNMSMDRKIRVRIINLMGQVVDESELEVGKGIGTLKIETREMNHPDPEGTGYRSRKA